MKRRIIIHCDLNSFFASVEILKQPWLASVPMAVAGDSKARKGVILAKNILAASYGVKTGEPIWSAKTKCPELITVSPHHDDYIIVSRKVRRIYEQYSGRIEAFGIDECWIDISEIAASFEEGREIADEIREKIHSEIGITASCGVSFNKVFAKLGSDMKKPDATTVIDENNFKETVWTLPVERLLFVGGATVKTLNSMNIFTVGQLAQTDTSVLERAFGKNGIALWINANGEDKSPVEITSAPTEMKSVSNSMTLPRDITDDTDIRAVLLALAEKVSGRMRRLGYFCDTVSIFVRYDNLEALERQIRLDAPNRTAACLFDAAYSLCVDNDLAGHPIRALGIKASNLSSSSEGQMIMSYERDKFEKYEKIESLTDDIRSQFGKSSLKRGIMLADTVMSDINEEKQ